MKTCTKCGVEKAPDCFGPSPGKTDGLQSHCRDCRNAWKSGRDTDAKRAERQAYRLRHPERHAAQRAVRKAVARGTLVRPSACEACGGRGSIQAHHEDYAKRLDVRWLCVRCHADMHMARIRVDFRLPPELVAAVDEARGDVTRTRFVERALEKALGSRDASDMGETAIAPSPAPSRPSANPLAARQAALNKAKGL